MTYWRLQMSQCDDEKFDIRKVEDIFRSGRPYIGVNEWNGKHRFKSEINKDDIVVATNGAKILAIVKVKSDLYEKSHDEIGYENRRDVDVIVFNPSETFPNSRAKEPLTRIHKSEIQVMIQKYLGENKIMINNYESSAPAINLLNSKRQIILYGPAGTGKTYNTKNIIVRHAFGDDAPEDSKGINKKYQELRDQNRIQFVTFHQSFAYEDFIEGIKPVIGDDGFNENSNSGAETNSHSSISYKVEPGIFQVLCDKARENYYQSNISSNDQAEFESKLESFKSEVEVKINEDGHYRINDTAFIYDIDDDAFRYKGKQWQSYPRMKFDDLRQFSIDGVKTRQDIKKNARISKTAWHHASYFFMVYQAIIGSNKSKDNVVINPQNYYLIIDEINRGNISKIFGELITLLEANKRLGEPDEIQTTLPYSKEKFGIPPNLYIIGTMNTSDKSIAHLDIALRRRFGFVEMLPSYDENIIQNEACRKLLKKLNDRIEILLDKDHLIGHSFFMGVDKEDEDKDQKIEQIMRYEVVPLLEEYFYSDFEKIQEILGKQNLSSESISGSDKQKFTYWFQKVKKDEEEKPSFDPTLSDNLKASSNSEENAENA